MPTRAQRNAREDPSPLLELPSPRRNRVSRPPMPSISDPGDESVADIPLSDIPSRGPRDSPHNPFRSSSASQATTCSSASRKPENEELLECHILQHSRQGSEEREDLDKDKVFSLCSHGCTTRTQAATEFRYSEVSRGYHESF